jgi:hypothetical protein
MPPEQVLAYLEAFRTFTAATGKAEALAAQVIAAAALLKDWRKTAEAPHNYGTCFEPGNLPDGPTVRQALDAWVRARTELFAAWKYVPKTERDGLMPPPGAE